jgi:hypothetical protein
VSATPLILYVPGLLPKPAAEVHRAALLRCLLAGIKRLDEKVAADIAADPANFDIVSWTYEFYGEHRDIGLDTASIDAVVAQAAASQRDIDEATSLMRRLARRLYALGDLVPFLIPHIANERMELHLRDLQRYLQNRKDVAQHSRLLLRASLVAAREAGRPILLIAHSMGSVIAFETLWQLSRATCEPMQIDLFLTMGSPLGQRYMQKRIKGRDAIGAVRFPDNIRRWVNLTAVGDLTAIDPTLSDDFGEMVEHGLVEYIDDRELYNWFRLDGELNTHAEYGYLVNAETASVVVDWWRTTSSVRDSAE